jgi:tetratricopeptide (TPR) repeat protein
MLTSAELVCNPVLEAVAFGTRDAYILRRPSLVNISMNTTTSTPPKSGWTDWTYWPYVIVGLAVVLRLLHILNSRVSPTFWAPAVDPAWFDQAAQAILKGNWGPFPLFRAPVYPALLAATYGVFGHDLVAARLLNVLLQGLTCWMIWKVGRSYFSPKVGLIAGWLFALNGMAIYFACEMVSTSVEMFAAILGLWSIFRLTRELSPRSLVLCGLAWGFAAITRPNNLVLFPVVLGAVWLIDTRHNRFQLKLKATALATWSIAALIPILPITAANVVKGGELVLIATQGGVNFWIGNNPEASGILSVLPGYGNTWTMEDAQSQAEMDVGHKLKAGELSNYYYSKGKQFLLAHPLLAVRFMIRKTALFFNQFEISNNKHIAYYSALSPWLPPLQKLNFGLLIPFSLLGFWVLWKRPIVRITLFLLLAYALTVILFFVTSRFRMPAVPWMVIIAAAGMVWALDLIPAKAAPRNGKPLLLLLPGLLIAYLNIWNLAEAPIGWARYMDGNAYLKLNNLDSARVCFLDAIRDNQALSRSELNLGVVEARSGNYTEAIRWYQSVVSRDPGNPDAWNNLGTVYESLHDTTNAVQAYNRALLSKSSAENPRHNLAGLYFQIGVSALKHGDDSLAIRHLSQCIALEPTAVAYYDIAIAYGRSGQNAEAIAHLNEALAIDPGFSAALQLRGQIQSGRPAYPKASGVQPAKDPEP